MIMNWNCLLLLSEISEITGKEDICPLRDELKYETIIAKVAKFVWMPAHRVS
jgi:hypothetical protein